MYRNRSKKPNIQVIFSSTKGTGDNTNRNYFIDWNALFDKRKSYKVSFNMITGQTTSNNAPLLVAISFGQTPYVYKQYDDNTYGTINWTGMVKQFRYTNLVQGFLTEINTNEPVYLELPPSGNFCNIKIIISTTENVLSSASFTNWVMFMNFQEI